MSETNQTTDAGGRLHGHRRWFWIGGRRDRRPGRGDGDGSAARLGLPGRGAPVRHGGRGHGFAAGMMHDPAAAKQHAGMALEWLLRGVSASDEQKQQARRITDRLIDELAPSAEKHREHREAIARELAKPQIDRDAIERLRKEEIALADDASRKVSAAVADLAEVLTPEQRAEILDLSSASTERSRIRSGEPGRAAARGGPDGARPVRASPPGLRLATMCPPWPNAS